VDWPKIHDRYMAMVEHCASREDMAFVMGERISELTVGNACVKSAGDTEKKPSSSTRASGGDAFPNYFRGAGLGKLIGMRTWGGLVGIWGNPALMVDGGDCCFSDARGHRRSA